MTIEEQKARRNTWLTETRRLLQLQAVMHLSKDLNRHDSWVRLVVLVDRCGMRRELNAFSHTGCRAPNPTPLMSFLNMLFSDALFPSSAELEAFAKRNPKQLLRHLELYLTKSTLTAGEGSLQAHAISPEVLDCSPSADTLNDTQSDFTGVCDLPTESQQDSWAESGRMGKNRPCTWLLDITGWYGLRLAPQPLLRTELAGVWRDGVLEMLLK